MAAGYNVSALTVASVERMHYSELVALIGERNRPSGGIRTVQTIAANALLTGKSSVLEIGSTTGFTTVNLSLLCGCRAIGIDLNNSSVVEARRYAAAQGVQGRTIFLRADATCLPFRDGTFDLVFASNVTSFIEDKAAALDQYLRVLAPRGYLAAVPIYYRMQPPKDMLTRVEEAINAPLRIWTRENWIALFRTGAERSGAALELVFDRDYRYSDRADELESYCDRILDRPRVNALPAAVRGALAGRYRAYMALFNENLRYCGFSILLFQKRLVPDEEELFLSEETHHACEASASSPR